MDKYQDMRVYCLQNGGEYAQKVMNEREQRYSGEWALRFPFDIKEYPAFVVLSKEMQNLISSINQKNIQLTRLCCDLPKEAVRQYARNSMVEEIQQSNEFENVHSTRREIREALYDIQEKASKKRFAGMVRKYDMLISHKEIHLNNSADIRRLYDEFIIDEVVRENANHAPDGTIFRKDPNYVHRGETVVHEGLYPERKIIEAMDGALVVLNDQSIDPLIRVAVFHYAFGYIHPFYDGNGRMSRFISSYMLSKYHYSESACLRISYVIKDRRHVYQRIFKNANDTRSMGDISCFVIEFLRFIEQAIDDTLISLNEKENAYTHYQNLLNLFISRNKRTLGKYETLLLFMLQAELFGNERFDVQTLAYMSELSSNTIRKIMTLCDGLIVQEKDGNKNIYHISKEYLDYIESTENHA